MRRRTCSRRTSHSARVAGGLKSAPCWLVRAAPGCWARAAPASKRADNTQALIIAPSLLRRRADPAPAALPHFPHAQAGRVQLGRQYGHAELLHGAPDVMIPVALRQDGHRPAAARAVGLEPEGPGRED